MASQINAGSAPALPIVLFGLATLGRDELEQVASAAIDRIDMAGDPDLEPAGDEQDAAWIEWSATRGSQKRGPNIAGENEDARTTTPTRASRTASSIPERIGALQR